MKQTRRNHTTLADVARLAGVGKATVSRVINGGKKVAPETLQRINRVMRELNYWPSQAARSLKGTGMKAIGLVVPRFADPFFALCAEAAQEIAQSHGYLMIMAATNYDAETEIKELENLIRHRVEGILLAPGRRKSKRLASLVNGLNIPIVALDHPIENARIPTVLCDNRNGARVATKHLLQHGCRRIVCLGGESRLYTIKERQKGYADAIRSAGLDPIFEPDVNTNEEVEAALRKLCLPKKRIDAIFAVRNFITIFAFKSLRALGLCIPNNVALIGFDDFDLASTLRPAVTVIQQPIERIGSYAAQLLFQELNSSIVEYDNGKVPLLDTTLVIRNSCGCAVRTEAP